MLIAIALRLYVLLKTTTRYTRCNKNSRVVYFLKITGGKSIIFNSGFQTPVSGTRKRASFVGKDVVGRAIITATVLDVCVRIL